MTHIVISAVNIRKGGTLTILRSCLAYLSDRIAGGGLKVTALVHSKDLCCYPGIDYIEMPSCIKSWPRRLWAEYVTMHGLSKRLAPIDLWLSLHDTTPHVNAQRQAVYCQTSFPFYRWHWRDFRMDFKIPLFAMLTRFAYRINVHRNSHLIVQQRWLREHLSPMLGVDTARFIIAPPEKPGHTTYPPSHLVRSGHATQPPSHLVRSRHVSTSSSSSSPTTFFYASTPDCHKNFETLAEAVRRLEKELGCGRFQAIITVRGDENRYARWLHKHWGDVSSLKFEGLMDRRRLFDTYAAADCLVFPSKIETWGLPISEFMPQRRPMILSDLPYAHETAAGAPCVAFFPPDDADRLASLMRDVIRGNLSSFSAVPETPPDDSYARSWNEIFSRLLK